VNEEWFEVVNVINKDEILGLAVALAALRRRE